MLNQIATVASPDSFHSRTISTALAKESLLALSIFSTWLRTISSSFLSLLESSYSMNAEFTVNASVLPFFIVTIMAFASRSS